MSISSGGVPGSIEPSRIIIRWKGDPKVIGDILLTQSKVMGLTKVVNRQDAQRPVGLTANDHPLEETGVVHEDRIAEAIERGIEYLVGRAEKGAKHLGGKAIAAMEKVDQFFRNWNPLS